MPLPEVQSHHYTYAPLEFVEEGINCRIKQGVGGPKYLEEGAEIEGHLHMPRGKNPLNTIQKMPFKGEDGNLEEVWTVQINSAYSSRIIQDEKENVGFAVFGMCIDEVGP